MAKISTAARYELLAQEARIWAQIYRLASMEPEAADREAMAAQFSNMAEQEYAAEQADILIAWLRGQSPKGEAHENR